MNTSSPQGFKADILVIDDTPENLNLLNVMLTEQGYKVRSVTKGSTGIRGAQTLPPDLILLDIKMPIMSGYEVCEHLKADERTRDIPVIFISALGDVEGKVRAFSVGGVDYITKPFQVAEVLARINSHLTIRHLQRQLEDQNLRLREEIRYREQAEQTFTTVFQKSLNPMAIATLPEGTLINVNPSLLKISGMAFDSVLGQPLINLFWRTNRDAIAEMLTALVRTNRLQRQEFEFMTPGYATRILLVSMEQIDVNQTACVLLTANDITEQKQLENEFISLVSHELRTPLTSLMGSLDILTSGKLGELNEYGRRILAIATASTERLIRLINDILDLERIQSGEIVLQKQSCQVVDLCRQAVDSLQAMAAQSNIEVQTELEPLDIHVDPDRLVQTLTNLLSNAIKFSEMHQTIRLKVEKRDPSVCQPEWKTSQHSDADQWCCLITVQDQGRGIPPDKLHTIFDRFQQVDSSDSRKNGGTGLGLSICRSIVQQHEGRIWVESTLGEGSTFYVSIPQSGLPI
jgi:PAS domain S-box-containing protein